MRTNVHVLAVLALAAACGGGDETSHQRLDSGLVIPDATEFAPMLTSFVASPNMVAAGVPTDIVWNWTYLNDPTFPEPTCSIDNGVGAITRGETKAVTLTQVTTFKLTCVNSAGMASRNTIVGVPAVAPVISSFTVSPTSIAPNTNQAYTFSWTYSNTPSPAPTCFVDGAGAVTNGGQVSLNLTQARIFRLRCTNSAGTTVYGTDAIVQVNECGTSYGECNPNAICSDSQLGYTCTCSNGFTPAAWVNPPTTSTTNSALGDTCYFNAAGAGSCDTNATYNSGGGYCQCNPGYVGSGADGDCTRARIAFVTSVTGTGQFSTWANATGAKGTEYADSICAYRAGPSGANLPGTYKAWVSDSTDDAYCRIAGFSGKKSANCGQGAGNLPTQGGPWIRLGDRRPFAPTLDKLAQRVKYYPAIYNESGAAVTSTTKVWTGTDDAGVYTTNACTDWSTQGALRGTTGLAYGGSSTWTRESNLLNNETTCASTAALLCLEVGAGNGPPLPPRHPPTGTKKAFLTSVTGNGALNTWPDAHGQSGTYGYPQADEICRSRARYAGYSGSNTFKAWLLTYSYGITSRISNYFSSPYARPDGIVLGTNAQTDMVDGRLNASWDMTELNTYEQGNVDAGLAWVGMSYTGYYYSSSSNCGISYTTAWQNGTPTYTNTLGKFGLTDERYNGAGSGNFAIQTGTCDTVAHLYCVED